MCSLKFQIIAFCLYLNNLQTGLELGSYVSLVIFFLKNVMKYNSF